jgi:beta-glucanase (GH16 family)
MNTKLFGAALMSIAMFSCKKNLVEDNQLAQRSAIDPTTPKNVQPYMINENAGPTTTNAAYGGVVPWNLTWSDEFTTNGVNHSKWTERNGAERWRTFNPGNVSVYCYQSSDMISQTGDGYVRIGAMKWKDGTTYKLKCGLMDTENLFDQQYGYFEARMKVPTQLRLVHKLVFG